MKIEIKGWTGKLTGWFETQEKHAGVTKLENSTQTFTGSSFGSAVDSKRAGSSVDALTQFLLCKGQLVSRVFNDKWTFSIGIIFDLNSFKVRFAVKVDTGGINHETKCI